MSENYEFERRWNLRQVEGGTLDDDALGEIIRLGALTVQKDQDLTQDGLCGPATIAAIGLDRDSPPSDSLPIPKGRRPDIEAVYGAFDYEPGDRAGAITIERGWVRRHIGKCTFHTGQHTWAHKGIIAEMIECYREACEVSGYTPQKAWSYVPRFKRWHKTGKYGISTHSWGIAIDFDSNLNRVGNKDAPLLQYPEFVKVWKDKGWTWGGDWKTYPDYMHFQRTR